MERWYLPLTKFIKFINIVIIAPELTKFIVVIITKNENDNVTSVITIIAPILVLVTSARNAHPLEGDLLPSIFFC